MRLEEVPMRDPASGLHQSGPAQSLLRQKKPRTQVEHLDHPVRFFPYDSADGEERIAQLQPVSCFKMEPDEQRFFYKDDVRIMKRVGRGRIEFKTAVKR